MIYCTTKGPLSHVLISVCVLSTWQSRWTSSGRSTINMLKCTSSWTCRPETWSRATTNWFRTTGRRSRRSRGKAEDVQVVYDLKYAWSMTWRSCVFSFLLHRLTETVELLQTQVEELQHQVEELKLSPQPQRPPHGERQSPRGSQSVSCLSELQNTLRWGCSNNVLTSEALRR